MVLIIGAGIIGCAIARELRVRGVAVQVLDDRPVAGGATQASAGILAPYIEAHDRGPLLDLAVRSLALYDDWIAAVARDAGSPVEYRRIGTLEIALDADHAAELRASASAGNPEWLDRDAARALEPALGPLDGALLVRAHGYVAPRELTDALARAAERRGASFRRARVSRIERDGPRLRVTTAGGAIAADRVVVAAGSWTGAIETGDRAAANVRPVRGQLLHLGWQGPPVSHVLWGPECYIVPRADGSLLVGATVEEVGFDERATAAGVRDLLDAVCELLPQGWGATFCDVRVGLRPATSDDLPIVGEGAMPGVVYATGHYRNGVLLAPLTARIVADLIVEGRRDPALDVLSPDRF
jgi:glycine oxidase